MHIHRVTMFAAILLWAATVCGQTPAQPAPAQQPGAAPQPTGRAPIKARNQAEYDAYRAAVSSTTPETMEKSADDFATKFPDSDLRVLLYRTVMHAYQSAGNSQKMLDMGLKVLAIDADDPEALIGVAEVQEEHTSPTDLDREQRMNQAVDNAQHALRTIDTDLAVPAGTPADKVEAYKKYLRATAFAIIGSIQYKREKYADAETALKQSLDADPGNPDAVIILRLALALDQQKKYPEALEQAKRAVELSKEDTAVGKMAREERDRLLAQTSGGTPSNPAPASTQQTPAPPPQ